MEQIVERIISIAQKSRFEKGADKPTVGAPTDTGARVVTNRLQLYLRKPWLMPSSDAESVSIQDLFLLLKENPHTIIFFKAIIEKTVESVSLFRHRCTIVYYQQTYLVIPADIQSRFCSYPSWRE